MSTIKTQKYEPQYLDGGWGWIVMIASFMSQTVIGSVYFGYGVLLPEWMDEFDSSGAMTSLVGSTVGGVISASGPFASWMILKTSCRATHVLGGAMLAISAIACSFATSIIQIFIFYSITAGIGGSLCFISSVITLSEYFKHKRSVAVGIASSGIGFGSFVFPVVFESLIESFGWRGAMLISGAIYGNMIAFGMIMCPIDQAPGWLQLSTRAHDRRDEVVVDINHNDVGKDYSEPAREKPRKGSFQLMRAWIRNPLARRKSSLAVGEDVDVLSQFSYDSYGGFPETIPEQDECPDSTLYNQRNLGFQPMRLITNLKANLAEVVKIFIFLSEQSIAARTVPTYRDQLVKILKKPLFYVLLFHNITMFVGVMIAYGLTALRAVTDYSMTLQQGALLVSIIGLSNLFGRLLWGVIAAYDRVNTTALFIGLRVAFGVSTLTSTVFSSFEMAAVNSALIGLAFGNWSIYPVVLADLFGDRLLAIAFGYLETANGVGGILGSLLGGYLHDISGTYQYSFVAGGVSIFVGLVPFVILVACKRIETHRLSSTSAP